MKVAEYQTEATLAYTRNGASQSLKFRCTHGPRKGQVRASPAACNAPINIQKSKSLSLTKKRSGKMMSKKSAITKSGNPTSKRVSSLNKSRSRGRKKL
jgi:hypothetical protein|tara:strand:+ start:344 stop:637 length:294 start_codon:yes stop_codon:yes gene_type:complete